MTKTLNILKKHRQFSLIAQQKRFVSLTEGRNREQNRSVQRGSISPQRLSQMIDQQRLSNFKFHLQIIPNMSSQSNYKKILDQFTPLNLNQNSKLSHLQLKKALDTICQKNAGINEFNLEVAEQLWQETQKIQNDFSGTITLRNFINILIKAHAVLHENIAKSKQQLNSNTLDRQRRYQLQESIVQFNEDLKLLTIPFQLLPPAQSRMSNSYNPAANSRISQNQSGLQASGFFSARSSGIFADFPSKRENSGSLKFTFILTVFLFLMEMVITFHKHHFYSILVYVCIFAIVVMGYFDKYYMKFILANLILSVGFDFIWILAQASPYWNPNPPTHHSTIQTPFLRFLYFFVIILMLGKVVLVLLLFRYRNNDDSVRKSVTVMGNVFEIDGRVKDNNPISQLLSGRGVLGSTFQ